MFSLEQLRENGEVICAAVYLSVVNMSQEDAEQIIAEQLHKIHEFADLHDIVIIDSYIERDDSLSEWDKLIKNVARYRVVLHCGGIGSHIQDPDFDFINVYTVSVNESR